PPSGFRWARSFLQKEPSLRPAAPSAQQASKQEIREPLAGPRCTIWSGSAAQRVAQAPPTRRRKSEPELARPGSEIERSWYLLCGSCPRESNSRFFDLPII